MGHRPTIALKRLLFWKKQSINYERKGVGAKTGLAEIVMALSPTVRLNKKAYLMNSSLRISSGI